MDSRSRRIISKARGAQIKTENKFLKAQYVTDHIEGLDEPLFSSPTTQIFYENPKKVVNKVTSPDLGMDVFYQSISGL